MPTSLEQAAAAGADVVHGARVADVAARTDTCAPASAAERARLGGRRRRRRERRRRDERRASATTSCCGASRSRATSTGGRSTSAAIAGERSFDVGVVPAATAGSSRRRSTRTSASAAGRRGAAKLRGHLARLAASYGIPLRLSCPTSRVTACRCDGPGGRVRRAGAARRRRGRAGRPALGRRDLRGVRLGAPGGESDPRRRSRRLPGGARGCARPASPRLLGGQARTRPAPGRLLLGRARARRLRGRRRAAARRRPSSGRGRGPCQTAAHSSLGSHAR